MTGGAEHRASRRGRRALARTLRAIMGRDIAEVRITRVRWDDGAHWVALALAVDPQPPFGHREIPLADGSLHREIALLIQNAFPGADWSVAQDYDVTTGVLREHQVHLPACLRGEQP
ncbi:hypothetical protein ACF1BS_04485 [Streptomyces sp. NPDC014748]|uniref:hypothetical protein n=1 Tax=Streptomyces sp. NPDC014748 TaxID=3364905 RepID=UPI0036F5E60B